MDMLTDFQQMQSNNEFMIPQTHEEHLLENIKNRQNMRNTCYDLNVNGQTCRMTSRHSSQSDGIALRKEFLNILIPDAFKGKPLELLKFEFEPVEGEEAIKQVSLIKKNEINHCLVQQSHIVTFDLKSDFEFRYTDPETEENKNLYIKEFSIEPIEKIEGTFSE